MPRLECFETSSSIYRVDKNEEKSALQKLTDLMQSKATSGCRISILHIQRQIWQSGGGYDYEKVSAIVEYYDA